MHSHTHALSHARTHTFTRAHARTHAHTRTRTHAHIHSHMHMHAHTHARAHACTRTCTHRRPQSARFEEAEGAFAPQPLEHPGLDGTGSSCLLHLPPNLLPYQRLAPFITGPFCPLFFFCCSFSCKKGSVLRVLPSPMRPRVRVGGSSWRQLYP